MMQKTLRIPLIRQSVDKTCRRHPKGISVALLNDWSCLGHEGTNAAAMTIVCGWLCDPYPLDEQAARFDIMGTPIKPCRVMPIYCAADSPRVMLGHRCYRRSVWRLCHYSSVQLSVPNVCARRRHRPRRQRRFCNQNIQWGRNVIARVIGLDCVLQRFHMHINICIYSICMNSCELNMPTHFCGGYMLREFRDLNYLIALTRMSQIESISGIASEQHILVNVP